MRALLLALTCMAALGCARSAPIKPPPPMLRATFIEKKSQATPAPALLFTDFDEPRALVSSAVEEPQRPAQGLVETAPEAEPELGFAPEVEAPAQPSEVIARANARAAQTPTDAGYDSAVMRYAFVPGGLYKVFAAPGTVTDIMLKPGEQIVGQPAAGDTVRWRLATGEGMSDGLPQAHVFIKPVRAGLSTNLTLHTSERSYFLRLESLEQSAMIAVGWDYPDESSSGGFFDSGFAPARRGKAPPLPEPTDVSALNLEYAVSVAEGEPSWVPQTVYDDGKRTYIRFAPEVLYRETPVLHVIARGKPQLVNYVVRGNLYVVDRIFRLAELRLGQDEPDVVRIRRLSKP